MKVYREFESHLFRHLTRVSVAVKHTRLSSVEIIGSNPIRGTNIEFIRLNPNWYRDLTVNQATVGSNPTKRANLRMYHDVDSRIKQAGW